MSIWEDVKKKLSDKVVLLIAGSVIAVVGTIFTLLADALVDQIDTIIADRLLEKGSQTRKAIAAMVDEHAIKDRERQVGAVSSGSFSLGAEQLSQIIYVYAPPGTKASIHTRLRWQSAPPGAQIQVFIENVMVWGLPADEPSHELSLNEGRSKAVEQLASLAARSGESVKPLLSAKTPKSYIDNVYRVDFRLPAIHVKDGDTAVTVNYLSLVLPPILME